MGIYTWCNEWGKQHYSGVTNLSGSPSIPSRPDATALWSEGKIQPTTLVQTALGNISEICDVVLHFD